MGVTLMFELTLAPSFRFEIAIKKSNLLRAVVSAVQLSREVSGGGPKPDAG
jgi:hypothetical protein